MKHIHYFIIVFFFSIVCMPFCSFSQVANYKGIFLKPPEQVPTPKIPDGPIAGNGDVGMVYGGTPDQQCFYFSKNDFWKAQEGYPDGGIRLVGGLNITVGDLKNATYHSEQDIENGTISAVFKKSPLTYRMKAWVQATRNLVIIELTSEGKPCNVNLNLWPQTGDGSRTDKGVTATGIHWVERHFDSNNLEWPTHIAVGMKVLGAHGLNFRLEPYSRVRLVLSFTANHDTKKYFSTTISRLAALSSGSIEKLRMAHINWWKRFWRKSHVDISDTFLEKYYYGSQYLLASCSRNKNFPPGLWGNSLTMDAGFNNWAGDYHTNYNYEAPWWGCYSSNHIGLTEGYDNPILEFMPKAKELAKTLLGGEGVYYPVGIGPQGFCSSMYPLTKDKMMKYYHTSDNRIDGGYMFLGQKSDALLLTANMFMRFYCTYDKKYAEKIYPFLTQVAKFWGDYLQFENGRYMDYNDNFWEVGPWEGNNWQNNYGDINPTLTLGLLKMFYKGIIDVSSFLHKDDAQRNRWDFILQHLSPIPTIDINGPIRIKACEGGTGSGSRTAPGMGRVMMQGLVFPSGFSGVKTDPEFAGILRKEIDRWVKKPVGNADWRDANWNDLGNGIETYFTAAARLGYDPQAILDKLKWRIKRTALPNLWVPQSGGGIESLSAIPSCINEMLLQGYEGIIRVFPDWPAHKDAQFEHLRTYGAFLVSSAMKDGKVKYIKIKSEAGRKCILENPWKGGEAVVKCNLRPARFMSGDSLIIDTHINEDIFIRPFEHKPRSKGGEQN
ncbi:MAG: trehalose hydrolase [Chitinophagaceae bacterium]|nr:MAG: trehalose hydrolase [Chitinophagaceae bacterium]